MIVGSTFPENQWQKMRLGKCTSSKISVLLKEPKLKKDKDAGNLAETAKTYIEERVGEIVSGRCRSLENIYALEWGKTEEPHAIFELRKIYPDIIHYGVDDGRFFSYNEFSGGSPDYLRHNNRVTGEIKCVESESAHVRNLMLEHDMDVKEEHFDYWCQLQHNMLSVATELKIPLEEISGEFVSYHPNMLAPELRLKIIPVQFDFNYKSLIDKQLDKAADYYKYVLEKINKIK